MHVLCLQSGPTVLAMGAFHAEKGSLIRWWKPTRDIAYQSLKWRGTKTSSELEKLFFTDSCMGVGCNWDSGPGREVIISNA